jgi:alpha-beta hydrolase superfamily lysophospholipase
MPHVVAIVVLTIFAMFMATATMPSGADAAGATNFQAQAKKKCKNVKKAAAKQRCVKKTVSKLRRQAAARLKGPAGLKFYTPTRPIPAKNGTLIWSRPAGGVVPLESAASTRLILHSSKSVTGKKVAVSGSVSIPKGKAPAGGWPVISYGHGTTGIADQCAPSRNTADGPANAYISYTDAIMNSWLDAGYAVARSDYEGLGTPGVHPFLVGKASGRGILDIVRAAHQMNPKISKRFVITGHSQGGHAALFAADQASTWTPDLKLKGTVAYAPASQLAEQLPLLDGFTDPSSLTALASMIVRGISSVYPEVDADALLSDTVLPFYPDTLTECLAQLSEPDSLAGIAPNQLVKPGADTAVLLERLAEQNPLAKSSAPILLAQGDKDTTTFPFLTRTLNTELRKIPGNRVTYIEKEDVDHGAILDASKDDIDPIIEGWLPGGK